MRKILLTTLLMLTGGLLFAQLPTLPIDFESTTINYTFTDFDGGGTTVIANPDISGINTSATVARMIKSSGQVWGGSLISTAAPMDFSTNKIFTAKVWSPRVGARMLLKVENATNGAIFFEKEDTMTVANAWEELTFDFSAIDVNQSYSKLVFIFDLGTMGDGTSNFTFYFDDINLGSGGPGLAQIDLPITFDNSSVDYTVTDFGGNMSAVVADPTNPANMVCQSDKTASAQLWAGTTASTPLGLANAIPFAMNDTKMNVRVWSPDANIPVRLKVEDRTNNTITCETEVMTTMAGAWETLEFDFANPVAMTPALDINNTYDLASIFFNFGTDGATAGAKTYYWDDVMFGGIPIPLNQIDLPVTFEDTMVDYTMTDFGGNTSMVVADPTNPANTVAEVVKDSTAQLWAGTTISTPIGFATAIPFMMGQTTMTVRVWSPDAGIQVRLKAEDHTNNTVSVETEATTTMAGAWETLTFDFANEVMGTAAIDFNNTYDMASIFFNFGVDGATAGTKTYYFDDVEFSTGIPLNQIDLPVTFEDTMVDYTMTDFGGNVSMVVVDPTNPANMVAEVEKTASAQTWAGTTVGTPVGFANAIPFVMGQTFMTVKVWSPDAGIQIRLKAEDHTNNAISVETEATTTMAGAWETLTFDFSNEVMGTAAIDFNNTYDMASIFFNFGVDGATAGAKTYYFDDVEFAIPISTDPTKAALSYYPNPASDHVVIRSGELINTVKVFDLAGHQLISLTPSATETNVDVSTLAAGMYIFVTEGADKRDTFRVVVQ